MSSTAGGIVERTAAGTTREELAVEESSAPPSLTFMRELEGWLDCWIIGGWLASWLAGWMDGWRRDGCSRRSSRGRHKFKERRGEDTQRTPKKKGIVKLTCSLAPGKLSHLPLFLCSIGTRPDHST